ncbi:pyridoxal phosphate-dependent transferase [Haematococcus lacustris]
MPRWQALLLRLDIQHHRLLVVTSASGHSLAHSLQHCSTSVVRRRQSTTSNARVPLDVPTYAIWGANTGIGKTLASVALAYAARRNQVHLLYLKPVQTGFPSDSDARLVAAASGSQLQLGPHAAVLDPQGAISATAVTSPHAQEGKVPMAAAQLKTCKVLHAWSAAVGPHKAVEAEGRQVPDADIQASVAAELQAFASQTRLQAVAAGAPTACLTLVETAGGVASPAPSGNLMCDVLRPLRLPAVLVGDARLGGISCTISAYESLLLRGYDVEAILFIDPLLGAGPRSYGTEAPGPSQAETQDLPQRLGNAAAVQQHLQQASIHRLGSAPALVLELPGCPAPPAEAAQQQISSEAGGEEGGRRREVEALMQAGLDASLALWLQDTAPAFDSLLTSLQDRHHSRLAELRGSASRGAACLWWPFTQHTSLGPGGIQVVDSRSGEEWQTLQPPQLQPAQPNPANRVPLGTATAATASSASSAQPEELGPLYDACCSWWTQGATAEVQPELSRAVAYAAGRYLHVLSPQNVHQLSLRAAERLLEVVGKPWASRVFFSDDGSTAIEVALKMAFRKFMVDKGLASGSTATAAVQLQVVGLQDAYHGDTLGAMDCVAPSVFNAPLQTPWYRGRGLFLQAPNLGMVRGRWQLVSRPAWLAQGGAQGEAGGEGAQWDSLEEVVSPTRDESQLTLRYRQYIEQQLDEHQASSPPGSHMAALIIEPLVQGAGGMLLLDPQFQRQMVQACRARGMAIIFDEVMTGLYRVGSVAAGAWLREQPDIACFAKLMTAGLVPMAATLATDAVFHSFDGDSKMQALLHGHSYTAFPIGCATTVAALELLTSPSLNRNLCTPQGDSPTCPSPDKCRGPCGKLVSLWDAGRVSKLSHHSLVSHVVCCGSLLAVQLQVAAKAPSNGGAQHAVNYTSLAGASVQLARHLRDVHGVYARPLGEVVYLMVPPTTSPSRCSALQQALIGVLDDMRDAPKGTRVQQCEGDGVIV